MLKTDFPREWWGDKTCHKAMSVRGTGLVSSWSAVTELWAGMLEKYYGFSSPSGIIYYHFSLSKLFFWCSTLEVIQLLWGKELMAELNMFANSVSRKAALGPYGSLCSPWKFPSWKSFHHYWFGFEKKKSPLRNCVKGWLLLKVIWLSFKILLYWE